MPVEWAQVRCKLAQGEEGYRTEIGWGSSVNRLVAGSNPAPGANKIKCFLQNPECSQD